MLVALVMFSLVLAMAKLCMILDWSWWVIWLPAMCSFFVVVGAMVFSIFAVMFVDPFKVSYR